MLVRTCHDVLPRPCDSEDSQGCRLREVLGKEQGAPRFVLNVYEMEPGGFTPFQATVWEHELYVLEGRGTLRGRDGEYPLRAGDAALVMPGELHQVRAEGGPLRFICLAPRVDRLEIGGGGEANGLKAQAAGAGR